MTSDAAITAMAMADAKTRQSGAVASGAEEATQNVNTVSAATEELSASIREIAEKVAQAAQMTGAAMTQANETNEQVQSLAAVAQKIGEAMYAQQQSANSGESESDTDATGAKEDVVDADFEEVDDDEKKSA